MPKRWVGNTDTPIALHMPEHGFRGLGMVCAVGAPSLPQGPKLDDFTPAQTQPKGTELPPQGVKLYRAARLSLGRTKSIPSQGGCHTQGSKTQP